jgi:hypothetical protein
MGTISGAISNGGILSLVNTTVAHNMVFATWVGNPGGLANFGSVVMQNTLLALNNEDLRPPFPFPVPVDCDGVVTSLGHNLIGDPTGCTITLRPSDLTGDPGLATFTDDGAPGQGHFPWGGATFVSSRLLEGWFRPGRGVDSNLQLPDALPWLG